MHSAFMWELERIDAAVAYLIPFDGLQKLGEISVGFLSSPNNDGLVCINLLNERTACTTVHTEYSLYMLLLLIVNWFVVVRSL